MWTKGEADVDGNDDDDDGNNFVDVNFLHYYLGSKELYELAETFPLC